MTILKQTEAALHAAIRAHQQAPGPRRALRCVATRVPSLGVIVPVTGAAVAVLVAVLALGVSGGRQPLSPAQARVPAQARALVSKLAVLRRAQTAQDRSLLATVRRADHNFGSVLSSRFSSGSLIPERRRTLIAHASAGLRGIIPSLTRRVAILRGGVEVFLVVYPAAGRGGDTANLVFVFTDPRSGNLPVVGADGYRGTPAGMLSRDFTQYPCFGPVDHGSIDYNIIPDGVSRMQWLYNRQDDLGFVYRHPLTMNVPVRDNVVIATVPGRTPCELPNVVKLYGAGRLLRTIGNPALVNRITRPVRHGKPFGP